MSPGHNRDYLKALNGNISPVSRRIFYEWYKNKIRKEKIKNIYEKCR